MKVLTWKTTINLDRIKHGRICCSKFETYIWNTGKTGLPRISNQQNPKKWKIMVKTTDIGEVRARKGKYAKVVKSSRLPVKIVAYLVSNSRLLCLAFLYGWRFLNKISLDWPLTLTTQPSTSRLSDNPDMLSSSFDGLKATQAQRQRRIQGWNILPK